MSQNRNTKSTASDPADQISQVLEENLPQLDVMRAAVLDRLHLVRVARAGNLNSEHARLSEKLGADDPRVRELAVRQADNDDFILALRVESERARVEVPEVQADTWILHGFVFDQQLRGISGVTVALYDPSGEFVRQLGFVSTSTNGHFLLKSHNLEHVVSPVFIHVLTAQGAHLHTDDVPLTPEAESVVYHEVIVTGASAGTPPGEGRDDPVAQPGVWTVRGRVADQSGKGLGNLIVSLYDKDYIFDDRLGQAETDDKGEFEISYRTEDFRDLIERKPDIYVKVFDQEGNELYSSKKKFRFASGRVEIVNVVIKK
jgi:hypothetical protein